MIAYLRIDGQTFALTRPVAADEVARLRSYLGAGHTVAALDECPDPTVTVPLMSIERIAPIFRRPTLAGVGRIAAMAGIASAFGGGIPFPTPRQKPPRPADPAKLAAAEAKRERRAKRRMGASHDRG